MILMYSDFNPNVSGEVDKILLDYLSKTSCCVYFIPAHSDLKRRQFEKVKANYEELGVFDVNYFDLGDEYDASAISKLKKSDVIHLGGGDPLNLLKMVRARNFEPVIKEFLQQNKCVVGVSAGAMILTQSLSHLKYDDEYKDAPKFPATLKLVDFEFCPHWSELSEENQANITKHAKANKIKLYACDDTSGLLISNSAIKTIGPVLEF